jgi:hypothetical protein
MVALLVRVCLPVFFPPCQSPFHLARTQLEFWSYFCLSTHWWYIGTSYSASQARIAKRYSFQTCLSPILAALCFMGWQSSNTTPGAWALIIPTWLLHTPSLPPYPQSQVPHYYQAHILNSSLSILLTADVVHNPAHSTWNLYDQTQWLPINIIALPFEGLLQTLWMLGLW